MSNISIDSWNDFMYKVGEDFYNLIHGEDENNNEYTRITYDNAISYKGAYLIYTHKGASAYFPIPYICDFNVGQGVQSLVTPVKECRNSNLYSYSTNQMNVLSVDYGIVTPNSYMAYSNSYYINADGYLTMLNYAGLRQKNIFRYFLDSNYIPRGSSFEENYYQERTGQPLLLNPVCIDYYEDYNGYENYFSSSSIPIFSSWVSTPAETKAPAILRQYPVIINTDNFNVNTSIVNSIQNNYIDNSSTINNYTYNIDSSSHIDVSYSVDSNDVPTGYIDINPTGEISFDDLFDMFNTILAPLVGVGLDLPDWNTFQPPVVTGDVNVEVNIDLPDVTGEYPAETITPIDSDVYNIITIDSMPQLPSLTGIDNGEAAAALGVSFSFLDGCGLLMPFIIIAIIRLLISKFRGDS